MSRRRQIIEVVLVPLLLVACDDEAPTSPADPVEPTLCDVLAVSCAAPSDAIVVGEAQPLVPSEDLPSEVSVQEGNNNLDVSYHDGRIFLAFRSAPNHFASSEAVIYVISSADHQEWAFEARFSLDTDLREPRLLSWNGKLFLYFGVLGDNPYAFEPQGTRVSEYLGPGDWSYPEPIFEVGFMPWRARVIDEVPYLIGYTGGENIYEDGTEPLQVRWLTTTDGLNWTAVVPGQEAVLTGGSSETDFAFLADGTLVAVARNEEGDDTGFGSQICRAAADDLGSWECAHDPKKYDSPLVFRHGDTVYLIGRRNLTESGNYDLGYDDRSLSEQFLAYETDYWVNPKRCSLWEVDHETLTVEFVLDLPSRGDTCFASVIPLDDYNYMVYNYSSPLDGDDVSWVDGQMGPTLIYTTVLTMPTEGREAP